MTLADHGVSLWSLDQTDPDGIRDNQAKEKKMPTLEQEPAYFGRDHERFTGEVVQTIPGRPPLQAELTQYLWSTLEHRQGARWSFTHRDSPAVNALIRKLSEAGVVFLTCERPDQNSANVWIIRRGPEFSLDNLKTVMEG